MTYEYMRGNGTGEATTEVFYTYDELHQVVTAKENYGNKSRSYQYDSLGNLTLETNSNNVTVDYKLNNLNQITTSSDDGWKTSTAYSYDKRGNLIQELYTKGKKQSVTGAYTFDETNKMVKGVNDLGESSVYLYNGLGALVEQTWTIKKNSYGYHDGSETAALTAQEGTETESGANAEAQAAAPTPDAGTTLLDELDAMGDPAAALDVELGIMPLKNDHSGKKPDDKPGHKPNQMITVVKQFFPDYTRETLDPLVENEVGGLEYRYVYGNERLSVNITGIENGAGSIVENGSQVRLYYHQDLRGTVDYLTSPVSQKIESWTHYNEWGEITHNAVLKCGQRQLDLVKNYTGHEYDSVLGMYYAKARFYDAENRKFISLDPIMDSSRYDVSQYATTPAFFVQYLYVKNSPLVYIDPMGLMYDDIVLGKVPSLPQTNSIKSAAAQKPVLTLGKTGNDVYNLQKILIDAGYYHYTDLDGSFGPKTYAAVQEFQRANGLQVDGSVGPQTWTVILGGQYVQGKDTQGRYSDQRQLNNELKQTRTLVNMRVVSTTSMSQKDYIDQLNCEPDFAPYEHFASPAGPQKDNAGNYGYGIYAGANVLEPSLEGSVNSNVDVRSPNMSAKHNAVLAIDLIEVGAGVAVVGGDYQNGGWELQAVTADANVAIGITGPGLDAGARLIQGSGSWKIWLNDTKYLEIEATGDLIGAGASFGFVNGKWKMGLTLGIGGSISVGIKDKDEK